MDWLRYGLIALGAYLLGSLNFAIVISRLVFRFDIRTQGSGNAGSTNAFRVMGKVWGSIVALGDIIKGIGAVLLGGLAASSLGLEPTMGRLVGGLFAVLGHCFPLYFDFRGGKGVLTMAAVMLFIDWKMTVIALAVFFLTVVLTRYISLGSMLAAASLPLTTFLLLDHSIGFRILTILIALAIILLHRKNIVRLAKKQESKFSLKKKQKSV